jgi:hypothetical protein
MALGDSLKGIEILALLIVCVFASIAAFGINFVRVQFIRGGRTVVHKDHNRGGGMVAAVMVLHQSPTVKDTGLAYDSWIWFGRSVFRIDGDDHFFIPMQLKCFGEIWLFAGFSLKRNCGKLDWEVYEDIQLDQMMRRGQVFEVSGARAYYITHPVYPTT